MGEHSPIGLKALISHRFRGFAPLENTLAGLRAALDFGVLNLEFDVRVDAAGAPMVYHDEYAPDSAGVNRLLCDYPAWSYKKLGGRFAYIPSLEALFSSFLHNKNKHAMLMIDIKDQGFEEEIHALVMYYGLAKRVVYVSWLPEVLYRLHDKAPDIPLIFSHWSGKISPQIAAKHKIFISKDGHIPRDTTPYITGKRMGWALAKPLRGDLLDVIKASKGGICVPKTMLTKTQSEYYHEHGILVSSFSYTDLAEIKQHNSTLNIDRYFVDKKQVFEQVAGKANTSA